MNAITEEGAQLMAAVMMNLAALGDIDAEIFTSAARASLAMDMPKFLELVPALVDAQERKERERGMDGLTASFHPAARLGSLLVVIGYLEDMLREQA